MSRRSSSRSTSSARSGCTSGSACPQILAAILTTAIIEIVLTFRQTRSFVWPASAMLTGSGVALILRVVGTPPDDPWNTYAWYVFAGVAAFSLLTKYVIKYRGTHVFNPSNIGLVVAFVVLGSTRVEPLDFWWGPLDILLIIAYAVIIGGGLLITRRLRLLGLAASFWLTLAVGIGILAASGHCMTANWAFAPVCGSDYWRVIVTSPEVLIFLFFMITDPKTVPGGQVGRVAFGALVAVASTLLMAPQTNEFGTKVGLLAGLVVICAGRPILDRVLPEPRSAGRRSGRLGDPARDGRRRRRRTPPRWRSRRADRARRPRRRDRHRGRGHAGSRRRRSPDTGEALNDVPHQVDPATFPAITVEQDVTDWDHKIAGVGAQPILMTLAENLELENQALLRADPNLLTAVDHGDRLAEMQARLSDAAATGHEGDRALPVRSVNVTARRPVRRPDRAEPRVRIARQPDRGDVRRVGGPASPAGRRRSRRRSWCAGRRATAGSTSPSCPTVAGG